MTSKKQKPKNLPTAEAVQAELAKVESIDDFFGKEGVFAQLFAKTLEEMLEAELSEELSYEKYEVKGRNSGNSRKGKWLLVGTLISLPASIYFTWDAYHREDKYLGETDPSKMENLYSNYNTSYKLRNGFITAYLALWFYAQFDVFSQKQSKVFLSPQISNKKNYSFLIQVRF